MIRAALAVVAATAAVTGMVDVPVTSASPPTVRVTTAAAGLDQSLTLTRRAGLEALGVSWRGAADGTVEYRTLGAGGWGDWTSLQADDDLGMGDGWSTAATDADRVTAGPVWLGDDVRGVQVRPTGSSLSDLRAYGIDAGRVRTGGTTAAADAAPFIVSRAAWGADERWRTSATGCDGRPRYAPGVRNAIVHHTEMTNTYRPQDSARLVRAVYWFHTHVRGWCDIGYNFLVDRFGQVFEGRAGGVNRAVIGAHTGGFNTGSTGVALMGNFNQAPLPTAAYNGLRGLLAWKLAIHRVDPNGSVWVLNEGFPTARWPTGSWVRVRTISGHGDFDAVSCPGGYAYARLPTLRADLARGRR